MTGNAIGSKVRALLASAIMVLAAIALMGIAPQGAYAQSGTLVTATMEDAGAKAQESQPAEVETTPKASLSYAVCAKTPWVKGSNGAAASVKASKRLTGLYAKVSSKASGGIQYATYVHGYGWQAAKANGKVAGKKGKKAERFDSLRIVLTGQISTYYDVEYRVKMADGKWQSWKRNGQVAGKSGGNGLRGVQIRLVTKQKKGSVAGTGLVNARYRVKQSSSWKTWVANNAAVAKVSKHKRVKALAISLDKGVSSGSVKYRVRLSNGTWKAWKKNGKSSGTYGNIEAFQVKLTGKLADTYDVVYRAYVKGVGWQARVRNGATAGTSKGRAIESIKVQLVKKTERDGWVGKGSSWSYYKKGVKQVNTWVKTKESPINVMTSKSKRYWLDATGKLAVKRIVEPKAARDSNSTFAAYATKWGYIMTGDKKKTSKGFILAGDDGVLVSAQGWVRTDACDRIEETYRMKNIGSYSVAQTGFFKVNKKKYYGDPSEGYIMRDMTFKVDGKWYTAKHNGAVGKASSTEKCIERYVRWAVNIANDDSHGYSWDVRWGPDYDCSSLVISALKNTGLSTGDATYTGNMRSELTPRGFVWHTDLSKIKRGDILLVHREGGRQHTEIYLGKGLTVGAHINEFGGVYGGRLGDQTGHEIDVGPYESIWQGFLRFGS